MACWDVKTGKARWKTLPHNRMAYQMSYSPDGSMVATGSRQGGVSLIRSRNGSHLKRLGPGLLEATCCCFSPNGKILAVGGRDREPEFLWSLYVLDAQTGRALSKYPCAAEITSLCFLRDGNRVIVGDSSLTLSVHDLRAKKTVRWKATGTFVSDIVQSPTNHDLIVTAEGQHLRLWDLKQRKERKTWGGKEIGQAVAFHPSGKMLFSTGPGTKGSIALLDMATGQIARRFQGHQADVYTLAVSPNGEVLASAGEDRCVHLWNIRTGKRLSPSLGPRGAIQRLFTTKTGQLVSGGGRFDPSLSLWDPRQTRPIRRIISDTGTLRRCRLSPEGERLLGVDGKGVLKIWSLETGEQLANLSTGSTGIQCAAILAEAQELIAVDSLGGLRRYRTAKAKPTRWKTEKPGVTAIGAHPRRPIVSTGHEDGTIVIWNASKHVPLKQWKMNGKSICSARFSTCGQYLLAVGEWGMPSVVAVYDLVNGHCLFMHEEDDCSMPEKLAALSPDTQLIVRHVSSKAQTSSVKIFERMTGRQLATFRPPDTTITSVTFLSSSNMLALGCRDSTIRIIRLGARPKELPPLSPKQLQELWGRVGDPCPIKAYQAMDVLARFPDELLQLIAQEMRPEPKVSDETLCSLLRGLDAKSFQDRARARKALRSLGLIAQDSLRKALQSAKSTEKTRSIRLALQALEPKNFYTARKWLLQARAITLLERINTRQARKLLQHLSEGDPRSHLARIAKEASWRVAKTVPGKE